MQFSIQQSYFQYKKKRFHGPDEIVILKQNRAQPHQLRNILGFSKRKLGIYSTRQKEM